MLILQLELISSSKERIRYQRIYFKKCYCLVNIFL